MTLAYNLSLAAEKAAKKAREEGIAIGEERGISIGLLQGEYKKAIETAKVLKSAGVEINLIINSTGLSPEEIEKL